MDYTHRAARTSLENTEGWCPLCPSLHPDVRTCRQNYLCVFCTTPWECNVVVACPRVFLYTRSYMGSASIVSLHVIGHFPTAMGTRIVVVVTIYNYNTYNTITGNRVLNQNSKYPYASMHLMRSHSYFLKWVNFIVDNKCHFLTFFSSAEDKRRVSLSLSLFCTKTYTLLILYQNIDTIEFISLI